VRSSATNRLSSVSFAFTLVELLAVIAILTVLLVGGIGVMGSSASQARRSGTDVLSGMIDQARTMAITTRSHVVLAIAEPGDLPSSDERCRLGLLKVESWPDAGVSTVDAVLTSRWRPLESGVVLASGAIDGIANPLDASELTINYGSGAKSIKAPVHVIGFNPRGGLLHPVGSGPIALRIAEGSYRNGKASPNRRPSGAFTESILKVGRVTARPYQFDP
jgi:type II secretory pathway pseudopilin PulG